MVYIPSFYIDEVIEKHFVTQKIISENKGKTIEFKMFQSGKRVETMFFALIDLYGNLMTTDSKSMMFVGDNNDTRALASSGDLEYLNSISGTFYTAKSGIFKVDSLMLVS